MSQTAQLRALFVQNGMNQYADHADLFTMR